MSPREADAARVEGMGWLLWAVVLPLLLVVAGVVALRRRGRR
jgi:cytochrome c-type biogenesis protein CcmH/NrfF